VCDTIRAGGFQMGLRDEQNGLILMLAAGLVFSLMNILAKLALRDFPFMETVFFRGVFGTIFIVIILLSTRTPLIGPRPRLLVLRGCFGFLGLSCYYFAMSRLTLADTVILNKVSPLFVMILAYFFLGEVLSRWHYMILAAALFGVYNVIQPQFDLAPLAGVIGLASAVFSGMAYIVVKKLSPDHHSPQIVLAFVFLSSLLAIPFMLPHFRMPSGKEWLILMGIGLTSSIAQVLMTKAYALGSPTPVSIASYSVVLFSALWGFLVFDEIQNSQALWGSLLVIVSLLGLPFLKTRIKTVSETPPKRIPFSEV
jgi:drug/metabolite transporter (DMT)-like permease